MATDTLNSILFACSRDIKARNTGTSETPMTLMTCVGKAVIYTAKPIVTNKYKVFVHFRQGKGCCEQMAIANAVNVSIRRRGWDNNPVEPAAIQAAAKQAIPAMTSPASAGASDES